MIAAERWLEHLRSTAHFKQFIQKTPNRKPTKYFTTEPVSFTEISEKTENAYIISRVRPVAADYHPILLPISDPSLL